MNDNLVADKLLIAEMGSRYCDACDRKDWDAALALFAQDAHLDASAVYGKVFDGRAQIREFFESAPDCLGHHATGFYSELNSDTHATARLKMLTLFKRNTFTVDYDWELNKVDGKWLIFTQRFNILGKQDLSPA